jgi:hypothetical protein
MGRSIVETGAAAAADVRRLWERLRVLLKETAGGGADAQEQGGLVDEQWQAVAERQ